MKRTQNEIRKAIARAVAAGALGLVSLSTLAEETAEEKAGNAGAAQVLDKIMVIGNPANVETMPGAARMIGKEEIRQQSYDDVNRVLRKVPGVYVREEFFGLFPSISLRGVDTTRSAKVTLMEDGVLMAPAPYSAPAAYYAPTTGRMSGLEVLMGSSQIKYGPHITGGVINYLSTPIPTQETVYVKSLVGDFEELRTHAYAGNTFDTELGQWGILVEGYFRQNEGFKRIDETGDFRAGEATGFYKKDRMVKFSWEPATDVYQRLEFKYARNALNANEGYLGLSETDFEQDPLRRYSASRFDNMDTEQENGYLRYALSPTDDLDIITTLYTTYFKRNWYKLKDLRNLPSASKMGLSAALAGAGGGEGLACLEGELACTLRVRANNREYESRGVESVLYYRFATGRVEHELNLGVRLHRDQVRRFQWDDDYIQAANGTITDMKPGTPGDAGDRLQRTEALAVYVQDTIEMGRWTLTPGVRYEQLDQLYEEPKGSKVGDNELTMTAGGIGAVYRFNDNWSGFGGVHRGFSPPSPKGAVTKNLKEETSTAYEIGARYTDRPRALAAEGVLFYTDFQDLIVVDNIGGAGAGDDENFGEARAYGLELAAQYDAGLHRQWRLRNPWSLSLTYTKAEQLNDARSTDPESIFSFGKKGNELPYVPELQFSIGTGIESANWGGFLTGYYVSETFTSANNVEDQVNGNGDPDARFGKTDSFFVTDLNVFYRPREAVKVFAGVQNLFDEEYLASRQPHGPRPGLPRFVYAGVEMKL